MQTPDLEQSDSALVERCIGGEERAWRELVARYGPLVYSVASRSCPAHDRDDVFQATFLALYKSLPKLRDAASLAKWIITTASRESWRAARRGKVVSASADAEVAQADNLTSYEEAQLVEQALRRLGGRCEVLLRHLFRAGAPLEYETLASLTGLPLGSSGPTRRRCLAKLAELLSDLRKET